MALYAKKTALLALFFALSKRHIVKQGLKLLPWIQAYYLNVYPAHAMRPKLFYGMFKDTDYAEIQQIAEEYAHQLMHELDPKLLSNCDNIKPLNMMWFWFQHRSIYI